MGQMGGTVGAVAVGECLMVMEGRQKDCRQNDRQQNGWEKQSSFVHLTQIYVFNSYISNDKDLYMNKTIAIILLFSFSSAALHAQTGTWSGNLEVQGVKLPVVFHLDEEPTVDSPDQGVKGIPVEVERGAAGNITVKIPSLGATYDGMWMMKKIVGTFTQMGVSFPLTLTPGFEKPRRPQTPQEPFPYATEEVSFSNGDAVLKGTLSLPEGWSRKTPVLVMVTGSGLQNRDEELFDHKPFAVIADAFARAGIATLRYDDRGFGESTGDLVQVTTGDLKNDALAGIALLRDRFDHVGVLGHSEGGTIALMLGAEGKVDFLVSLAGMVISGKETLMRQNRLSLSVAGLGDDVVNGYCSLLEEAFDACIAGLPLPSASDKDLPDGLKQNYQAVAMQLKSPYMKYFLSLDVRPSLGVISCPVLALNGMMDAQVECEVNLEPLRTGLPVSPSNSVVAVDGVNHLFQHCATGAVTEYKEIEETFSPEVLDLMADWINRIEFKH